MAKKAAVSSNSDPAAEPKQSKGSEARSGELENLREILFGNQARATDERLNHLEDELQTVHQDLTDALNKKTSALREAATASEKAITTQIHNLSGSTQANHQALEESLAQLRADTKRNLEELQAKFTQELENMRTTLSEQIRRMQNESRQRDDDLRQELLTVSSWLDNKLTPRHDLGQLLVEMGQHLQKDAGASADSSQDE